MKPIIKYYNKTMRLRQMNQKVKILQHQINNEAISLIKEIDSNRVTVPKDFTWETLRTDSRLDIESWNKILTELKTRIDS